MIDADVHCAPASWDALAPYLADSWREFVASRQMGLHWTEKFVHDYPDAAPTSGRTGNSVPCTYEDLERSVLDRSGADFIVLNCLTMFDAHPHPYFEAGLASALNDWLRAEWLARDERLRASLVVPWSDAEAAVAEVERVGDDPRFVSVLLPIRAPAPWGSKAHSRLHTAAAAHGLALALHAWGLPGQAPTASGFTSTYVEDYLSNATIVQQQVASLVASGAFERHPELRVVLVECDFTWLPSLLWRMDKHWRSFWTEVPWVKQKPSFYVRRNFRATTAPAGLGDATPEQIRELVAMVGPEWLLYASDYPHEHGDGGERLLSALDPVTRHAVLHENAANCYKLGEPVAPAGALRH